MSTISEFTVSGVPGATRVEWRMFFDGFHKTASGAYRGISSPTGQGPLWRHAYLRGDCAVSGLRYVISAFDVEPTTNLAKGSTRASMALFNKDTEHLLAIIFENAQIPDTPDPLTITDILNYSAPTTVPDTPSAPVASYVTDHNSVVFTLTTGASGGKLYRSVNGGSFAFLANVTASPYSDSDITSETDYAYKLSCTNSLGESALSVASNTVTTPVTPDWALDVASLSLTNNDPVATWTAVHGANATQSTSGKKPIYKTSQFGSTSAVQWDAVDDQLDFTEFTGRTFYAVGEFSLDDLSTLITAFFGHASDFAFVGSSGTQLTDRAFMESAMLTGDAWFNGMKMNPNAVPKALQRLGVYVFRTASNVSISNIGTDRATFFFGGKLVECGGYTAALTDGQIDALNSALKTKHSLSTLPLVLMAGDSNTASALQIGGTGWWHSGIEGSYVWPAQMLPSLASSAFGPFDMINVAKGAQHTGNLASVEPVNAFLSVPRAARMILMVNIGTNDGREGITAAAAYANLIAYCASAKSAATGAGNDLRILVNTVVDAPSMDATFLSTYNASVRGGDVSYDRVVDLQADTRLADATDHAYRSSGDEVHYTYAGQSIVAQLYEAATYAEYGITPPTPPAPSVTLKLNADSILGLADTDPITTSWPAIVGPTVAASAASLAYRTNQINSKPAVSFNDPITGSSGYFDLSAPIKVRTVFVLAKYDGSTFGSAGQFSGLLCGQTNTGVNSGFIILGQGGTTKLAWGNTTPFAAVYRNGQILPYSSPGYDFAPINGWWIGSFILPAPMTLSMRIGLFDPWIGFIRKMTILDGVPTAAQRYAIEAEFAADSGITVVQT